MKKYASIFQRILLLFLIIFTFGSSLVMAYGKSEYEYQHIYPRQYFQSLGDPYTFKLKEFEHRWIHVSKGYDNDWKDVKENTPWISRILGDNYLLTDDGDISMYSKKNAAIIAASRHITYAFYLYDYNTEKSNMMTAMHFDGISNTLYNVSYLVSIPAKLIHFSAEMFQRGTCIGNGNKQEYDGETISKMAIWMVKETAIGIVLSVIMIPVGFIIGLTFHPFQTAANLLFSVSGFLDFFNNNFIMTIGYFIKAFFHSIWIIFSWY